MTGHSDDPIADALLALSGKRHSRQRAAELVSRRPGLYAFYGDTRAWSDLGLVPAFEDQPLYVGKAERSLSGRDVGTHFATGKTGSSTVRRSLAALMADQLDLVAGPRNQAKPDGSASFGLEPSGDARLSEWMEDRLVLATWLKPQGVHLGEVETLVLRRLRPPLNLDKVGEPRQRLRDARRRMADAARNWEPDSADAPAHGPRGAPDLTYRRDVTEPTTPRQLATELGLSPRTIRQWMRDQGWQSVPYRRWELSQEQAAQVRQHFDS